MKVFALILAFALFFASHAPAQDASAIVLDPTIQQVVTDALPAKWSSYGTAIVLGLMIFGRFAKALADGRGIKGWISAIWFGTNSTKILIASLCLLTLPACSTPEQNQRLGQLVNLAVDVAVKRGAITAADAEAIRTAETIILPQPAALPAITVSGK